MLFRSVAAFQGLTAVLAPTLIMPLFNKFTPLPEGRLRQDIEAYARQQDFPLQGIYTMDGSRRSSKANAMFTGFGRFRRIVLFDTLLDKYRDDEVLAVLAHEMGHFKRRHVHLLLALGLLVTGLELALLGQLMRWPQLFQAFGSPERSVYAGLVYGVLVLAPLHVVFGLLINAISRRFEFAADAFAAADGLGPALRSALTKLATDHRANLTPHRLKVVLDHSHPPVLARLRRLPSPADPGTDPAGNSSVAADP